MRLKQGHNPTLPIKISIAIRGALLSGMKMYITADKPAIMKNIKKVCLLPSLLIIGAEMAKENISAAP